LGPRLLFDSFYIKGETAHYTLVDTKTGIVISVDNLSLVSPESGANIQAKLHDGTILNIEAISNGRYRLEKAQIANVDNRRTISSSSFDLNEDIEFLTLIGVGRW